MVEFVDGSTLLQASPPTMMIPIALGLAWPDRVPDAAPPVRLDAGRRPGSSSRSTTRRSRRCGWPARRGSGGHRARGLQRRQRGLCRGVPRRAAAVHRDRRHGRATCLPAHDVPLREQELTVDDVLAADAWARARGDPPDRQRRGRARMTALYYTLGVLIFVVAILASIGLHELGHMIPAKKFGGKVTQYFVGFGTTRLVEEGRRDRVRRQGDPARWLRQDRRDAAARRGRQPARQSNTGMFTQLISDARAAECGARQAGGRRDRLFYKMPWWKKVIVMAGGPSVNIAIAFVHLRRSSSRRTATPATRSIEPVVARSRSARCPPTESDRDVHCRRPRRPGRRRGLRGRRPDRRPSTAPRSTTGHQCRG